MISLSRRLLPAMAAAMLYVPVTSGGNLDVLVDAHADIVNGGIGREEADLLRAQASAFPLHLVFVRRADGAEEFVADVKLQIVDARGRTVISGPAGPIFLARLPNGHYTVNAEYRGQKHTRRIAVDGSRHQKVAIVWS